MLKISLTTLNARYIHASMGLRYLYANMGDLQGNTRLIEFNINSRVMDIAETLLEDHPDIIGIGVYIWNATETLQLVQLIKTISPETIIVLGGPEVSYEFEQQQLVSYADFVITGQADIAFRELCEDLNDNRKPINKIIHPLPFELSEIQLPYAYYNDEDVRNRVIYVEASRGCPFKCEFCLSSLDKTVYPFDLDIFLDEMQKLYLRGVRHFKFVDRTFNLKADTSIRIMEFFLNKMDSANSENLFLHFELIPDHLPEKLKSTIARFPDGSLQFEIGIQSFDDNTQKIISRKQDNNKTNENIIWLKNETSAHLHTDLIVGLPGESIETFATGFNKLVKLNPHEIQVGILKRLRGTPIIRHTEEYNIRYNPVAPYNILSNRDISFNDMQRMNRFARYWDMIANSGRFKNSLPVILNESPFQRFMSLSDWLFESTGQTHKISLNRLFTLLFDAMTVCLNVSEDIATACLTDDFNRSRLKGHPVFNRMDNKPVNDIVSKTEKSHAKRQARHL